MNRTSPDDKQLIKQIAEGNADAINALYDQYHRLVFSVAFAIVGDQNTAEEIALDVFVQVWKHAATYRAEQAKVSTWLIAITRHHAIDFLRWQNSRPEANSLSWEEVSSNPGAVTHNVETQVDSSLQREKIRKILEQLPKEQRQALVLAYFKGYTQSQIAEALDQPLGTVKTRIRLAMQKLVNLLDDE